MGGDFEPLCAPVYASVERVWAAALQGRPKCVCRWSLSSRPLGARAVGGLASPCKSN